MTSREHQIAELQDDWDTNPRWTGVTRAYTAAEVVGLRGSLKIQHTLAQRGADKLWQLLGGETFVNALGALTGNQAVQQVCAGLKAIYLPGWQATGEMLPLPLAVKRISNALQHADQRQWAEGKGGIDFFAPIVADAQAESMKSMIEAGVAGVHVGDLLAAGKHNVLAPTREAVERLSAVRMAADVMGVPTLVIARTDAAVTDLLSSDVDGNDQPFCTGERTVEGHYKVRNGLEQAVARALAYAPYADLVWCETSKPDLAFAQQFAAAVHAQFPGKMLAYNCSPSFNWKQNLDDATIARFQQALGAMGYKFQFIALAGFHALNYGMFNLAHGYARRQMPAFVELQEAEFAAAERGFSVA
ncbi:isocitrate lyase [Duganella sp. FT135W]|uniref:Isocitrate lyase n=1 Tax=Duganella flavida TaxID=2692175 RepID=A0A6L8KGV9_9BURK|nr:isocitrate lyase [Duganella flavida]